MSESYADKMSQTAAQKERIMKAASGKIPADLVLKNATYVNVA